MKNSKLHQLVLDSYEDGQLDKKTVDTIATQLKRHELKQYVRLLKQDEKKKMVFVTMPTDVTKETQKKIEGLFPGKKIVYEIDPEMISGIKITNNDIEYELSLNQTLHAIMTYLGDYD